MPHAAPSPKAIKDMVANVRSELSQKASLDQLEDLEHQQCKVLKMT